MARKLGCHSNKSKLHGHNYDITEIKDKSVTDHQWWLSNGSDDDFYVQQLICELGGGSAVLAWRRRVLNSKGHWKSVVVITADVALWRLSMAAVSFWCRASSYLTAAL